MRIMAAQSFFDWARLEDSPSLGTIRHCLEAIPDAALLQGLRADTQTLAAQTQALLELVRRGTGH